jgi:hypothetical protein
MHVPRVPSRRVIPYSRTSRSYRVSRPFTSTPTAASEETSINSGTRHFPACHKHERRATHRRGRHRHRHSEDSSEESEPHPSASRHRAEPTQARCYRTEYSSEDPPPYADNTSLYSSSGDQSDAESRQSVAPQSRRDTSDSLPLSGVSSTPHPEHSQNRVE